MCYSGTTVGVTRNVTYRDEKKTGILGWRGVGCPGTYARALRMLKLFSIFISAAFLIMVKCYEVIVHECLLVVA